jgi:hypothetical protein
MDFALVIILEALLFGLKFPYTLLVLLAELVRHSHQSSLGIQLLSVTVFHTGVCNLLLLNPDHGLVSLGLHGAQSIPQLALGTLQGVNFGFGVLILALELGDTGSLLLAILEGLFAFGFELLLQPFAVAAG